MYKILNLKHMASNKKKKLRIIHVYEESVTSHWKL